MAVEFSRARLARVQSVRRLALFAVLLLAFSVLAFVSSPGDGDIHEFVEAAGVGLIIAGITGRLWSTLYIGGRKAEVLVRSGPYSVTRNPLYVFSTIAAAGVGAQTGSASIAVLFLLGSWLAFHILILKEEAFLSGALGQPYEDYRAEVPRFLPNPFLYHDEKELVIVPRRLYTTLMDGLVFFAAMPLFELLEYLQETGWLPVLLRLP
ncbi:methyltransferase family protein [Zhengella sp. ZM62]|uniref:methyltransferase family protein n=1 Tax=Zhengella sedimenti TaxID=3390035 RepID=UPI003974F601